MGTKVRVTPSGVKKVALIQLTALCLSSITPEGVTLTLKNLIYRLFKIYETKFQHFSLNVFLMRFRYFGARKK